MSTSDLVAGRVAVPADRARTTTIAVVGITLFYSALVVPPILTDIQTHSSLACDMIDSHLPQINFLSSTPGTLSIILATAFRFLDTIYCWPGQQGL
jgi:hypothetical protein